MAEPPRADPDADRSVTPTTLTVRGVGEVAGDEIALDVPENRSDPASRLITIRLVRLAAIEPSGRPPVVYLAGGPGGSATGTAEGRRWPLFDALRQSRDVILFDQRGTGRSNAPPAFVSSQGFAGDDPGDRDTTAAKHRAAFEEARAFYAGEGVDIAGYTTAESAADIADVARALAHPSGTVSLLGISYGSHLALATIDAHPEIVDRAVLAGVEGLDQTVKLPARTDAYFTRLQAAIDADPAARDAYPRVAADFAGAVRRVLARLEEEPARVRCYVSRRLPAMDRTIGPFTVQRGIGYDIADPENIAGLIETIDRADKGDLDALARWGWLQQPTIRVRLMPTAMDLASGVRPERLALVEAQRKVAILGDATNFPMPHLGDLAEQTRETPAGTSPAFALPPRFRTPEPRDTPVLAISGTLDGRTYPEAAIEATAHLPNTTRLTVTNGGHNVFLDHPGIVPAIGAFLAGEPIGPGTLDAPVPRFVTPSD